MDTTNLPATGWRRTRRNLLAASFGIWCGLCFANFTTGSATPNVVAAPNNVPACSSLNAAQLAYMDCVGYTPR